MSKKIYVEENNNFGCIGSIIIILICDIIGFAIGIPGIVLLIALLVFCIVWLVTKTGRKVKKYKKNNPELVDIINKNTYKLRMFLDEPNKIMYLFADDKHGVIIQLPFSEFLSYKIYDADDLDKNKILEIATSLDDPNLSIIRIKCSKNYILETEKLLTYFIAQFEKGKYNN